ncbi:hypothetical protein IFT43_05720 [Oxalobacteraceae sp. CFBP 13708]|nr:hypothetical protein [Oxalobacteraceae sp. CFBP 13708]
MKKEQIAAFQKEMVSHIKYNYCIDLNNNVRLFKLICCSEKGWLRELAGLELKAFKKLLERSGLTIPVLYLYWEDRRVDIGIDIKNADGRTISKTFKFCGNLSRIEFTRQFCLNFAHFVQNLTCDLYRTKLAKVEV